MHFCFLFKGQQYLTVERLTIQIVILMLTENDYTYVIIFLLLL